MLEEGKSLPAFNLAGVSAKDGESKYSLKDMKGKRFILYFYPKDSTPG